MHKAKDDIMIFSRNQRRQENYALVLAPYLRDCVRGGVVRGLGERFGCVVCLRDCARGGVVRGLGERFGCVVCAPS
jgi:phage shock protein PspC (stress-responsive transcriptional regulator)